MSFHLVQLQKRFQLFAQTRRQTIRIAAFDSRAPGPRAALFRLVEAARSRAHPCAGVPWPLSFGHDKLRVIRSKAVSTSSRPALVHWKSTMIVYVLVRKARTHALFNSSKLTKSISRPTVGRRQRRAFEG